MQNRRTPPASNKNTIFIVVFVVVVIVFLIGYTNARRTQMCRTKLPGSGNEPKDDQAMDPLSPASHKPTHVSKIAAVSENVRMSTLNSRTTVANSYDRNNITGASSSTTNGSIGYINPPPSPETTRPNMHRPYNKHYKKVNKPPPPSPAETTDFCDESDEYHKSRTRSPLSCGPHVYRANILSPASNGTGSINSNSLRKGRYCYDREPCPPPPTPRSYYHSDGHQAPESSCPGSPSPIRSISVSSSTYFSPPPPPSPQLKN